MELFPIHPLLRAILSESGLLLPAIPSVKVLFCGAFLFPSPRPEVHSSRSPFLKDFELLLSLAVLPVLTRRLSGSQFCTDITYPALLNQTFKIAHLIRAASFMLLPPSASSYPT